MVEGGKGRDGPRRAKAKAGFLRTTGAPRTLAHRAQCLEGALIGPHGSLLDESVIMILQSGSEAMGILGFAEPREPHGIVSLQNLARDDIH